ncbi:hypothetical protein AA309_20340 [Microvirga vignae]|uniref:Uncharacterized protein n=1 Tax=Microvirga vignae TaxID=1225564 RepID=A0A0H1R8E1_9HYPH|nr:hypothetical protein AA309_20340 [Microvirga vignae]
MPSPLHNGRAAQTVQGGAAAVFRIDLPAVALHLVIEPFAPAPAQLLTVRGIEPATPAGANAFGRVDVALRGVEIDILAERLIGVLQRLLVKAIGSLAQRSSSSASAVESGMKKALRTRFVFRGRHHRPLRSRCTGPKRTRSLSRWPVR